MELNFSITEAGLHGVKILTPFYREDKRGYFCKNFEQNIYKNLGLENVIYEEFETYSKKNVIRGLHFQTQQPQAKIVHVLKGKVMDIVVDLRALSKQYGQWECFNLSDENHSILFIPEGFAHGFCVLSEDALVSYKCIGKYVVEYDSGIIWNDETLNIDWGIIDPIVSDKDKLLVSFQEFDRKWRRLHVDHSMENGI